MRVLKFCILSTLVIVANGRVDDKVGTYDAAKNDAAYDKGFANSQEVGCNVLGLVYCCIILSSYHNVIENALVTKAFNLKQRAEKDGQSLDQLLKDVTNPLKDGIEGLGLGIVFNKLGFNDLFKMVADGHMNREEITKALYDKVQSSGLKRSQINNLLEEKCPGWKYPTDPTGKGMRTLVDGNMENTHIDNREDVKSKTDCDALDFFYCCLTSDTVLRTPENSPTKTFKMLKAKAEKNGQSVKDILTSALKELSGSARSNKLYELKLTTSIWLKDANLTDEEFAKKMSVVIKGTGTKQDKIALKKLMESKCSSKDVVDQTMKL